jgi:hypothetical protein
MSEYGYRVVINGTENYYDAYQQANEHWNRAYQQSEERGGLAGTFERRLITTPLIFKLLGHKNGWTELDENTVVGPWEIIADFDGRC